MLRYAPIIAERSTPEPRNPATPEPRNPTTILPVLITHLLLDGASEYERKCHRIDSAAFPAAADPQLAHVYAPENFTIDLTIPYVANAAPRSTIFRKSKQPQEIVTPFNVPEAVEDPYFGVARTAFGKTLGSYLRRSVTPIIEQTMARIHRFRDDVTWQVFDAPPTPEELAAIDAWVDPAVLEDDYDGFTAEAMAAGCVVVASRTPINTMRCEKGRTGFLVPPGDPNELTHAILAALFKPEVARARSDAALQTVSKYRSRQRTRVLSQLYERLTA